MNETIPPKGTPLYNIIHIPEKKSCSNCKHLWIIKGMYGCGISGKLILEMFLKECSCDKYVKESDNINE